MKNGFKAAWCHMRSIPTVRSKNIGSLSAFHYIEHLILVHVLCSANTIGPRIGEVNSNFANDDYQVDRGMYEMGYGREEVYKSDRHHSTGCKNRHLVRWITETNGCLVYDGTPRHLHAPSYGASIALYLNSIVLILGHNMKIIEASSLK